MSKITIPEYKNPNKTHDRPFFRYDGFSICMAPTDKYPDMVQISKAAKGGKNLVGNRYLNHFFAMKMIDTFKTEKMIMNQIPSVVSVLESEGYDVDSALEAVSNDSFINI